MSFNESDVRQIMKMKQTIDDFIQHRIELGVLVGNLEFLLSILSCFDSIWKLSFINEITILESIDAKTPDLSKERIRNLIENSAKNLAEIIENSLDKYFKSPDPLVSKTAMEVDSSWLMCSKCNKVWEHSGNEAMLRCPVCECLLHNPRYRPENKNPESFSIGHLEDQ